MFSMLMEIFCDPLITLIVVMFKIFGAPASGIIHLMF